MTVESISRKLGYQSEILWLEHFDLCSGALVPEFMHNLIEGVLEHLPCLLLPYCVEENSFFHTYLNEKTLGMELEYMEDNHPVSDDCCAQNGMQCTARDRTLA